MDGDANTTSHHIHGITKDKSVATARDDDDITTIQPGSLFPSDDTSDTATIFEAFKEVSLDLTLSFSTQNSPSAPTSELPTLESTSPTSPSAVYPPSGPVSAEAAPSTHTLSRTISFASRITPLSPLMKAKKKFKSTKFSPEQSSSILRGSWPAIKYVGRGTPVDKNRRKEWSGLSVENVDEDGLLFSSEMRATSLDSRSPRLSSSSDWDFLNPGLPISGSPRSGKRSVSAHGPLEEGEEEERVPPLQKIEIKLESSTEDWASVMETVLSSAKQDNEVETKPPTVTEETKPPTVTGEAEETERVEMERAEEEAKEDDVPQDNQLSAEELDKLQSNLRFDINIDKALDLGFTPAGDGGTLFTLAAITDSDHSNLTVRRTPTVSSHSQYSTPSEGPSDDRPATVVAHQSTTRPQGEQTSARILTDIRSTAKADPRIVTKLSPKTDDGFPWWKKALGRIKRVQTLLRPHRNTC
ncbi:hypothetical protein P691DRAFT_777119 [Macrolepiota fuliginosa MF-IS2]|uniref:Uncharacterized protein n=1 Tax=Macrolepiota fuliginosa MF-IS2 TaxID=1400762 RepID=A0A9P5X7K8_9AGAR|nr:hypothetical protein P691DRAFT_777119 [Macrolepiota fuliginosa MF-IS2]